MTARLPIALAITLSLAGCQAAGGTGARVSLQTKVTGVQTMTRTFSIAQNPGLNKAAESVKSLTTALQGAFVPTAALIALSGMSRTPTMEEALTELRASSLKAAYRVSGVAGLAGAKLSYDDASGEVTGIEGSGAKVTFGFVNGGSQRSWDAVIEKSPDGTTGRFHIEVTGGWRGLAPQSPASRPAFQTQAMPALRWFGNEYPDSVESARFTLTLVPQGDPNLAITMTGSLDAPEALPNSTLRVPTHWVYHAQLPKLSFDWESTLNLDAGRSTLQAAGKLNVEGETGKELFTYDLKADEQTRAGTFAMTNVAAKVQLLVSGTQPNPFAKPEMKAVLLSSEDNSPIGTVALDPARPRFALVTLAADQSTLEWELYPEGLLPVPPSSSARTAGPGPR